MLLPTIRSYWAGKLKIKWRLDSGSQIQISRAPIISISGAPIILFSGALIILFSGAPRRSGMYAKRQDFVRCLLRLRWDIMMIMLRILMMIMTLIVMLIMRTMIRSRGGCSGLQARASLKLPQSSRQQQFVRFSPPLYQHNQHCQDQHHLHCHPTHC